MSWSEAHTILHDMKSGTQSLVIGNIKFGTINSEILLGELTLPCGGFVSKIYIPNHRINGDDSYTKGVKYNLYVDNQLAGSILYARGTQQTMVRFLLANALEYAGFKDTYTNAKTLELNQLFYPDAPGGQSYFIYLNEPIVFDHSFKLTAAPYNQASVQSGYTNEGNDITVKYHTFKV